MNGATEEAMLPIPVQAAREIAHAYGYDQVIVCARRVGESPAPHGEHVTTYGRNATHCAVAARTGNFLKHKLMGWPEYEPDQTPALLAQVDESAALAEEGIRQRDAALATQPQNVVPGVMHCAKCKFRLIRTNLHVTNGTTSAGDNKTEPCPNGCGPLWPVTWEQEARECWARMEEMAKQQHGVVQVTPAMAAAFKAAHDEHAAARIPKIYAKGQREEANIIVGLRAALEQVGS